MIVGLLKRFVVAEESMLPEVMPGARIVAIRQGYRGLRSARVGEVVVFASPLDPGMWLIKRVVGVAGDVVEHDGHTWLVGPGEMFVLSDNLGVTLADSRTFGPVPTAGSYRQVLLLRPSATF